jgi:protein-L-isoaspartate(D-aspartate) O-methyltransferase
MSRDYTAADFAERRDRMVRTQIEARGVTDVRALAALRAVPRELFVPLTEQADAYDDRALPIGLGQTISQPYMVASMTAALALTPADRVLEVGTGSGYQAAILGKMAGEVWSIERHAPLAADARQRLEALGLSNVHVVVGDGTTGLAEHAPYDAILVTAGAPAVPHALRQQLADGGRLVIPVGPASHQDLMVCRRRGSSFEDRTGEACVFVPLVGRDGWPG